MNPIERMQAVLHHKTPDRLPFFHVDHHLPRGEKERTARDRGMGIICHRPCYLESLSNVEVVMRPGRDGFAREYVTPIGTLSEKLVHGPGYGLAGYDRDWRGIVPRRKEFLVKKPEDYKVLECIVENVHYEPYYYPIEDQMERIGGDGIVVADLPYEPMERLLIEWVEWRRFYTDLRKHTSLLEGICSILQDRYEKELFPIAANSPSEVIRYSGNLDSFLVSPPMFEQYYAPSYAKCAEIMHGNDKLLNVHMDGRLRLLSKSIAESRVDIVEAFTPPPMGDLPMDEALRLWSNKIVWVNLPSSISTLMGPSPYSMKRYLVELLELMIPGERVAIVASTENRVPEENLEAMVEVMQQATLPLSKETIDKLRASCE
jgi:hypothetical protein